MWLNKIWAESRFKKVSSVNLEKQNQGWHGQKGEERNQEKTKNGKDADSK